ncbi:pyridoxal phosphate-dependent aminotransferase [Sphingosinicella humi]|uniref:Aminotransferase n=1 Tax=Allosphingosinicella humi TaxID=2068657 RepID=A0A2U2IZU7_9SPHN|nr:pyridoxal phosphate-dependent aminotransferase [Sphingosinicella humi]PWG01599.1 aminotransferase [Sphingosinicella humi]
MREDRRLMRSEYMHWAKNQPPAGFPLSSSEVPSCRLDRLSLSIADLELDGKSYHRYPPLRQAIGDQYGVPIERIVTADGTSMANFLALSALVAPGDEVLVEHPVYEPLLATARFLGAQITRFVRSPENGFRLDPDAVERSLTPDTRLIILANLHNPSSAYADADTLRRVGKLAARVGAPVLIDEVYLDAATDPAARSAHHLGDQFVCTSSLTKVYGLSGLRCGWIFAAPPLAEAMWRLNELFGVAQAHAAERLSCIAFEHLDELTGGNAALLERNRGLYNAFLAGRDDLDGTPMTEGITAFPRWRGGDVEPLRALLRSDYDTAIVPGRWFEMPDRFRLGVGSPTPLLEEGLARLGAALDRLR